MASAFLGYILPRSGTHYIQKIIRIFHIEIDTRDALITARVSLIKVRSHLNFIYTITSLIEDATPCGEARRGS